MPVRDVSVTAARGHCDVLPPIGRARRCCSDASTQSGCPAATPPERAVAGGGHRAAAHVVAMDAAKEE
jgi:hypothetical protein